MVDIALIVLIAILGIIGGIIGGAFYTVIKLARIEMKARKDYKKGKNLFEIKNHPKQIILQQEKEGIIKEKETKKDIKKI